MPHVSHAAAAHAVHSVMDIPANHVAQDHRASSVHDAECVDHMVNDCFEMNHVLLTSSTITVIHCLNLFET